MSSISLTNVLKEPVTALWEITPPIRRMICRHPSNFPIRRMDFDYRLEHDPRFFEQIEAARRNIKLGRGMRIEDIDAN
jgi:hypothetical protein